MSKLAKTAIASTAIAVLNIAVSLFREGAYLLSIPPFLFGSFLMFLFVALTYNQVKKDLWEQIRQELDLLEIRLKGWMSHNMAERFETFQDKIRERIKDWMNNE